MNQAKQAAAALGWVAACLLIAGVCIAAVESSASSVRGAVYRAPAAKVGWL